jgi:hypothetical protein
MTSTNTMPEAATPAANGDESSASSRASRKRLRSASVTHQKQDTTAARAATVRRKMSKDNADNAHASGAALEAVAIEPTDLPRQTKASAVEALLTREGGASLAALCEATGWQPHTCRAFLTGLRKKGREVIRASDKYGKSIYLIAPDPSPASSPAAEQAEAESN